VLNTTVLVAAGARLTIPVSCVEEGRWAPGTGPMRRVARRYAVRDRTTSRTSQSRSWSSDSS
jgi:hypothetical protein